jgi:hypothetical protein
MLYYRSVGHDKSLLKVSDLERVIEQRQSELIKLTKVKKVLDAKAEFRSRALLSLGSTIFFGQFAFIMGGTFVYFSWDIMEPISYVMLLTNFTIGASFYASFKKEMELQTLKEIFAGRFARRLYKKKQLDIDRVHQLEAEILELRQQMNKSIY